MKVWCSKYALTYGIREFEADEITDTGMVICKAPGFPNNREYLHHEGREWHRSLSEAITHALEIRDKKVVTMKKRMDQLVKQTEFKIKVVS